jgi:ribosomal-protein-alanine acetyltransferase
MEESREVVVRPVAEADAQSLREILAGSPEAAQWIDAPAMLVALEQDRVIGFVAYRIVLEEGEILNIAVAPDFRRRGVALRLLGEVLPRAAKWFLEVRLSNTNAQAAYRRLGFREIGRRPRYYADCEDALLFGWP